ncbi:hypothetical protein [Thermosulfurimonas sp.]|uniref:hypothetical protein n=1 Tax=Thermosulfurimonas sp. TaxID=2080236 RepID=UPI0025D1BFF8|nr:hypothetical protein [Thermosulfurimonas sp.]
MREKATLRSVLEILGLTFLLGGLFEAVFLPAARIFLFLLFFLIYGLYLRSYHRKGAWKLLASFHLLELVLFPAAGLLSGALFYLSVLFFLGGRDYGVPMLPALIVGALALIFFPPLFLSVHCILVLLVRRWGILRTAGPAEALRLSLLSAGLFLVVSAGIKGGISLYSSHLTETPEVISGPEITFRPLPAGFSGAYALLHAEFLHRRRIVSYRLILKGKRAPILLKERVGEKLLFLVPERFEPPAEGARLRLETVEEYPFLGEGPGPTYELPVRFGTGLPATELRKAFWVEGGNPGLRLEFEAHLPQEWLEVCLNFGGRLILLAGRGRELRFKAYGGRYIKRGKEEYLCYEPPELPKFPVLGTFSLFLPMPREDFEVLKRYGLAGSGFSPITLKGLLRARVRLPVASGKILEERFEATLAPPHERS